MTNYNDGNWHGHNGGECPVHPDTVVEAHYTNFTPLQERAKHLTWDHSGPNLIAFRVIKEYKESREFWILKRDGCAYSSKEHAEHYNSIICKGNSEIIHVREVQQ